MLQPSLLLNFLPFTHSRRPCGCGCGGQVTFFSSSTLFSRLITLSSPSLPHSRKGKGKCDGQEKQVPAGWAVGWLVGSFSSPPPPLIGLVSERAAKMSIHPPRSSLLFKLFYPRDLPTRLTLFKCLSSRKVKSFRRGSLFGGADSALIEFNSLAQTTIH